MQTKIDYWLWNSVISKTDCQKIIDRGLEQLDLLQKEGYIQSYQIKDGSKYKLLRLVLKYDQEGYPVIRKIQRVSKPGLRKYSKSDTIPRVLSGAGVAVLSTSKGLMTDRQARKENIGGEILCTVY